MCLRHSSNPKWKKDRVLRPQGVSIFQSIRPVAKLFCVLNAPPKGVWPLRSLPGKKTGIRATLLSVTAPIESPNDVKLHDAVDSGILGNSVDDLSSVDDFPAAFPEAPPLKDQIARLTQIIRGLESFIEAEDKVALLRRHPEVALFLANPKNEILAEAISSFPLRVQQLLLLLPAIGQPHVLLLPGALNGEQQQQKQQPIVSTAPSETASNDATSPTSVGATPASVSSMSTRRPAEDGERKNRLLACRTSLASLAATLEEVESFYAALGGVAGYQLASLELIIAAQEPEGDSPTSGTSNSAINDVSTSVDSSNSTDASASASDLPPDGSSSASVVESASSSSAAAAATATSVSYSVPLGAIDLTKGVNVSPPLPGTAAAGGGGGPSTVNELRSVDCGDFVVRDAALAGLEALPHFAEIYPVGGAGDRLGLRDETTGEPLPTAMLQYCGRSLLESLVRDVQAREYLHFHLTGTQICVPIAVMTSAAKGNHARILGLLREKNFFGREGLANECLALGSPTTIINASNGSEIRKQPRNEQDNGRPVTPNGDGSEIVSGDRRVNTPRNCSDGVSSTSRICSTGSCASFASPSPSDATTTISDTITTVSDAATTTTTTMTTTAAGMSSATPVTMRAGQGSFFLFQQPEVPVLEAGQGRWLLKGPRRLLTKPGGHGVIWKLMHDKGVFEWLRRRRCVVSSAIVRQISNPLAGTDSPLLALGGVGWRRKASMGFMSCKRTVGASEGVNVLQERRVPKRRHGRHCDDGSSSPASSFLYGRDRDGDCNISNGSILNMNNHHHNNNNNNNNNNNDNNNNNVDMATNVTHTINNVNNSINNVTDSTNNVTNATHTANAVASSSSSSLKLAARPPPGPPPPPCQPVEDEYEYQYGYTNIEYTDMKRLGIADTHAHSHLLFSHRHADARSDFHAGGCSVASHLDPDSEAGGPPSSSAQSLASRASTSALSPNEPPLSVFPANTNVLYVGIDAAERVIKEGVAMRSRDRLFPGLLFNLKKKRSSYVCPLTGAAAELAAGRMETTMQNIADHMTDAFDEPQAVECFHESFGSSAESNSLSSRGEEGPAHKTGVAVDNNASLPFSSANSTAATIAASYSSTIPTSRRSTSLSPCLSSSQTSSSSPPSSSPPRSSSSSSLAPSSACSKVTNPTRLSSESSKKFRRSKPVHLSTFVITNHRRKVTSSAKKKLSKDAQAIVAAAAAAKRRSRSKFDGAPPSPKEGVSFVNSGSGNEAEKEDEEIGKTAGRSKAMDKEAMDKEAMDKEAESKARDKKTVAIAQTPEGSFFDLTCNALDLLGKCGFRNLPDPGSPRRYLEEGPQLVFFFHPALGPLWDVVAQKLQGGFLAPRSETALEVAEARIRNLSVTGSLLVHADRPLGHLGVDGVSTLPSFSFPSSPSSSSTASSPSLSSSSSKSRSPAQSKTGSGICQYGSTGFKYGRHPFVRECPPDRVATLWSPETNASSASLTTSSRLSSSASSSPSFSISTPSSSHAIHDSNSNSYSNGNGIGKGGGNKSGTIRYSRRCGRLRLENVAVSNAGVVWHSKDNVFWRHRLRRRGSCRIILRGQSEFDARDVRIAGSWIFEVPEGFRMLVRSKGSAAAASLAATAVYGGELGDSGALWFLERLSVAENEMGDGGFEPSWEWAYGKDEAERRILLSLIDRRPE